MDKIILGLLMMTRLTVYEIRSIIGKNFQAMCSDSMGGIQAAVKKLLAAEMVTYSENVEKSVNKKRYSITDKGREAFSQWLKIPADLTNSKNMELGKLLFLGLAPADARPGLLDGMIRNLEEEHSFLLGVCDSINYDGVGKAVEYWNSDTEYSEGIKNATQNPDLTESAKGIGYFQMAALQYGIDSMSFHIEWLRGFCEKMKEDFKNES